MCVCVCVCVRASSLVHLDVRVVFGHVDEGGQALAEPHGDVAVHVDGEGFESLLEATHGVVLEGAGVLAQVHAADLGHAQTAHRDEACRPWTRREGGGGGGGEKRRRGGLGEGERRRGGVEWESAINVCSAVG